MEGDTEGRRLGRPHAGGEEGRAGGLVGKGRAGGEGHQCPPHIKTLLLWPRAPCCPACTQGLPWTIECLHPTLLPFFPSSKLTLLHAMLSRPRKMAVAIALTTGQHSTQAGQGAQGKSMD